MVMVLCFLGGSLIIFAVAFLLARFERNHHVPDKRVYGPLFNAGFLMLVGVGLIFAALAPVQAKF